MAYYDTTWYCNAGDQATTGHYSVAKRASGAAVVAGQLVRQFTAPAVGSERVFICIIAGTTAVATDATWVLTRGAKTVDGTATWMEVTGIAAVNGDKTNTVNWTQAKAINTPTLGTIIQRNNGASYQICTTAGTLGAAEPAFSDTAGVTTTETSATTVWTSLGPVTNFTGGQAPHARLANACATNWFAAGNTIYVGDNHAESQATAITIAPAVTTSPVGKIICHNHGSSYPPGTSDITTGASVSTTAAANVTFNPSNGGCYVYGLTLQAGVGISGTCSIVFTVPNGFYFFDNCVFKLATTSVSALISFASGTAVVVLNNTKMSFAATAQSLDLGNGSFTWQNTGQILATGSVIPTGMMGSGANGRYLNLALEGLDLSQLTGALNKQNAGFDMSQWLIKDCKLNAAMTVATPTGYGQTIQFVRSSS